MSGPYRVHIDADGWRWIGTPDQPTGFVALPHTSMHAAHRIVEGMNGLIREHDAQKDRAEKAEARVAELEAQVAAWSPARCYGEDEAYDSKPEPSVAELEQRIATAKVGYYAPCAWCWSTVFAPHGEQVTCHKCGRKTPVPAPEPTETVQKAPPPSPVGAPRSGQAPNSAGQVGNPAPVLGDPRASERTWIELFRLGTAHDRCGECGKVGSDRFNATCPACKIAFPHNSLARGGKCDPLIACPICTGRIPDPSGPYQTTATPEADAFRVYDEMLRNPGHPQRGLTAEEADAYTERLGEFGPVTLTDEDARCRCRHCEADRHDEEVERATTRVEASPAAAAEVEARTGAWVGLQRVTWPGSEGLSEDAIRATLAVQRPPRAGLPSRDEVAAFLEGLDPHGPWTCRCGKTYQIFSECGVCGDKRSPTTVRANVRDVRIHK